MFAVHFYENKNRLLTQLLKQAPAIGDDLKIKGRKGKVTAVHAVDEKNVHVQLTLEPVKKIQPATDLSKRKKR